MIKSREHRNTSCSQCGDVDERYILVGAIPFCLTCCMDFFGTGEPEFEPESEQGKLYYKLLKKWQKKLEKQDG